MFIPAYLPHQIIALLKDCEERLRLLYVGFTRKIEQRDGRDERQQKLAQIYATLREWVRNDICTLVEHLARLSSKPRNAINYDNPSHEVSPPDYNAWILQREYLNQMHLMRDAVSAIQNGLEDRKSAPPQ